MGCGESTLQSKSGDGKSEAVFGTGVHVGRAGNVDLTGRKMDFLGTSIVKMINNDELHRTATSLTLSDNKLYTLGKEMSLLPKLEEIDMDGNKFQRLPESLVQAKLLWRLNVSLNPIDALRGFDVAPKIVSLRSLTVRECNLMQVPPKILDCALLEELDLSDNPNMTMRDAVFTRLSRLSTLKVANCGLEGPSLPSAIKQITTLVTLDISGNAFTFEDQAFFGSNLPKTLLSLELRSMELSSVPQVVVSLKKLNALDLAQNPIETLDVLAGRLVKRLARSSSAGTMPFVSSPTARAGGVGGGSGPIATAANEGDELASVASEGRVSTSSRLSMSKLSKVGMIASVSTPIPIKKLSLRACDLRTVPKYFHKMTQLEDLDLSENDNLDDPNMTLFSLTKLRRLNVTGCPFAENPSRSRNEWFDIAKLNSLTDIQWELWKGNHNMSPYRTKIPIEICGVRLQRLNEVNLRRDLFVSDTVETAINLLSDGYFKVDLSVDDNTLYSYVEAVRCFLPAQDFFSPDDVTMASGKLKPAIHGKSLGDVHLKITIDRYIFFLAMQAANYDAIIIPPLDVMILHYAQITCAPSKYRADCEAICGRILNCNYRYFFLEQHRNPSAAKDAIAASKKIWNLMVRSAQKDLIWLRYDFWDKRAKQMTNTTHSAAVSTAAGAATTEPTAPAAASPSPSSPDSPDGNIHANVMEAPATAQRLQALPTGLRGETSDELISDFHELSSMDSTNELCSVLDQSITAHFLEQGEEPFRNAIDSFFDFSNSLNEHKSALLQLTLDWTRYVKYLVLYAYRVSAKLQNDSTLYMEPIAGEDGNLYTPLGPVKRASSILGPHYDMLNNSSFAGPDKYLPRPNTNGDSNNPGDTPGGPQRSMSALNRRTMSALSKDRRAANRRRAIQALQANPIPTIGITLLLYAHRTSHVKYFQTLSLLGVEDMDITWENTPYGIEETKKAWLALYDECYIGDFDDYIHACTDDGMLRPMISSPGGRPTYEPFTVQIARKLRKKAYIPDLTPLKSSFRKPHSKNSNNNNKRVVLCGGDTEYGFF